VLWKLNPAWHQGLERRLRASLVESADLYIRIWANVPFDEDVLSSLDPRRTRVASFFMGSDVRDYDVFRTQYRLERWKFPPEYHTPPFEAKIRALRLHERHADVIFSVPDQMGLALRPYHHLQVPLQFHELGLNVPGRAVPRVVHAPSAPAVKGTDVIEQALAALKKEGIPFEYVSLRQIRRRDLLNILTDADVLVDELIGHGPGWLSFEAMASGCAVATRYLENSPSCFRPPVWSIDEHNIVRRLRTLLIDRDLRVRLANQGRQYVEANNRIEHVVDQMLQKVEAGRNATPDYVPTFLTTKYLPRTDAEIASINAANALVVAEEWYRDYVAGKSHGGLVF